MHRLNLFVRHKFVFRERVTCLIEKKEGDKKTEVCRGAQASVFAMSLICYLKYRANYSTPVRAMERMRAATVKAAPAINSATVWRFTYLLDSAHATSRIIPNA